MSRTRAGRVASLALAMTFACTAVTAAAAVDTAIVVPAGPSVTVTGAATTIVQNDRMHATVRAEAEHIDPAVAANEVNARMAKALERAKAVARVEAKSAGYSTWQTWEKGRPSRWKVVQSLQLTSSDFAALASLLTRLQEDGGMLLSGMSFTLAAETRRKTEDALTREAVRAWQQRAATAADALGYAAWRPGRVTVSSGDATPPPRAEAMMRAQAAATASAPVVVEGGTTEITVTVSGDAVLDATKTR